MTGPASASVRPAVRKRPNVIVVEPRKTADRLVICPVVVAAAAPLAAVEAVTARVSVLPVVGSELLTGLYAAAGVTDQLFLDSGSTLDKVGHGAGQSGVCMVPAERLPELREVRDIMFSWMRPVAVSFSCRMKRVNWRCPYALMVAERHCNRKWTSTIAITVLRR